jgi:hypothetical protein
MPRMYFCATDSRTLPAVVTSRQVTLNMNANQHHSEQLVTYVYFLSSGNRVSNFIKRLENGLDDRARGFRCTKRFRISFLSPKKSKHMLGPNYLPIYWGSGSQTFCNLRLCSTDMSNVPSQSNQKALQYRYGT